MKKQVLPKSFFVGILLTIMSNLVNFVINRHVLPEPQEWIDTACIVTSCLAAVILVYAAFKTITR